MLQHPYSAAILTLAQTLVGTQVNSTILVEALALICKEANFDSGLIYEVDFSNQLCLTECFCKETLAFVPTLVGKKLSVQEQRELAGNAIWYIRKDGTCSNLETRLLNLHGAKAMVLVPIIDKDLRVCGMVLLLRIQRKEYLLETEKTDLSAMLFMLVRYVGVRMYQKRIQQTQFILENILDNTGIDIYVNDFHEHDILYLNKSMAKPYGGREMFEGRKCWQVLFPGQSGPCAFCPKDKITDTNGMPQSTYTWDYQRDFDGAWFRVFSSAFFWEDGRLAHVVSSANITDNKQNEALIENLANYDQLTKLPNRRMLLKACECRIDRATSAEQGYVLFFDIDGFKAINDTYGHDAGDEFLIALGVFFSDIPLLKNAIYRNGGDEFVAIIGGEHVTKDHIRSLAHFIHQRFANPWQLKKVNVFCNTSIGVACYPEDGRTVEILLQKADAAMYQVKKRGGGSICFGFELGENKNGRKT